MRKLVCETGSLILMQVAEPKELLRCMQKLLLQTKHMAGPQDKQMTLLRFLSLFTSNPAARLKLPHKGQVPGLEMATACTDGAVLINLFLRCPLEDFLSCSRSY